MAQLADQPLELIGRCVLTFTGMALDRAMAQRANTHWIAERLADPSSQVVVADSSGVLLDPGDPSRMLRQPLSSASGCAAGRPPPILLGLHDDVAVFALDLDALAPPDRAHLTAAGQIVGLREVAAVMSRQEAGLAAYLSALLNWHRRHNYCSVCGVATAVSEAGYSRTCNGCGAIHFPRTDPVVIVLVER